MNKCYFCEKDATALNFQSLPVCKKCIQKNANMKCPVCFDEMEVKKSKFGICFFCYNCQKFYSINKVKNNDWNNNGKWKIQKKR